MKMGKEIDDITSGLKAIYEDREEIQKAAEDHRKRKQLVKDLIEILRAQALRMISKKIIAAISRTGERNGE